MADTKIKDLTSRTPAVGDEIPINDVSGPNDDGKVTVGACLDIVNGVVNVDSSGTSTYATDPLARANHTGTQTASTISDLNSATVTFTNKTIDADGTGNSITNIENADIKAAAAIDATKIADGTVTNTEFQYIGTLTSDAQTQIGTKVTSGGALGTPTSGTLTNCTGLLISGITSATLDVTELNFVDGVTSAIQTQLNTKITASSTDALTNKTFDVAGTGNKLTSTSTSLGDILKSDGTDFKRLARGTANQLLRTNAGGTDIEWATVSGGAGAFTHYVPIVMEVPNDTVAYPDVFALGDASSKITGFWLPNSGTSIICFKCIVPEDLHGTPAAKVVLYMLPRTTVANSTVNLTLSRLYVNTTEDTDASLTAETAVDVELTSTADFLTIYEYDVTAEATAGELFHGTLTRTPGAANDDFTEDLFIVAMILKIEVQTA